MAAENLQGNCLFRDQDQLRDRFSPSGERLETGETDFPPERMHTLNR